MGSYSRKRYATESASFPKSANSAPGSYSYPTFADLPASGSTPGNTAFVVETNRLYIWSGVGWYLIATVTNASPTAITGVDGAYTLATDGTATTITAVSTDPEGFALTWSYAVSSGSLGSTATVSQADNVFTITPSTDPANEGTFSLTFSVTDGLNGVVSAVSSFTLSFVVQNSRYTALSVKAVAAGSNQTFDDASASNHTINVAGNSTTSTFSPHRHDGYSAYFTTNGSNSASGGTGQYIQSDLTSELTLDTSDFTISCWVYGISKLRNYPRILQIGPQNTPWGASQLSILYKHNDDNDSISLAMQGIGGNSMLIASGPINDNQWYHVAVTRSGSTFTLYIDGVSAGTYTSSGSATGTGNKAILIGSASAGDSDFHGYISDVRVINGTSIYAGNFTPPTEPATVVTNTKFLLGRLPYFKDQSASNHTITATGNASLRPKSVFDNGAYSEASHGASAYFDGTGDYLDVGSSGIANFGTGNFTIEFWINSTDANALGSGASNIINPISSTGSGYWGLLFQNGKLRWNNSYNVANLWEVNATTILAGGFNHIAVVRNSGAFSIYFNGVSQSAASGTFTDTTNYSGDTGVRIGSGNANNFVGTLSDLRIVSSAVYTTNFTPPTTPLTNSPTYPAMAIGVANAFSNAYVLSGDVTGSNATVNMAVGQTVNFTVNASGHPFYIRVSDGGASVSTPTATGQGATSGVVSWTPSVAGTYYYQCENHSGMIGTINVTDGVKFLLNPKMSISDLSQKHALTCIADAATSTTQVKFAGTKSIYLDGTGDFLQSSESVNIAGDWTIEGWYYFTTLTGPHSFFTIGDSASLANSMEFLLHTTGELRFYNMGGGYSNQHTPPSDFLVNNWIHIAVVRSGTGTNNIKAYINGTQSGTGHTSNNDLIGKVNIGTELYNGAGTWFTQGYIQDFRVSSIARYTANFTPPTAELQG